MAVDASLLEYHAIEENLESCSPWQRFTCVACYSERGVSKELYGFGAMEDHIASQRHLRALSMYRSRGSQVASHAPSSDLQLQDFPPAPPPPPPPPPVSPPSAETAIEQLRARVLALEAELQVARAELQEMEARQQAQAASSSSTVGQSAQRYPRIEHVRCAYDGRENQTGYLEVEIGVRVEVLSEEEASVNTRFPSYVYARRLDDNRAGWLPLACLDQREHQQGNAISF
eukprot:TRINITY_DN63094_c0_g1_i1.p1 TRINITY_DN63094_c0_g1~~TRINITY_DN63094_c0_g1_i1.p1  ORF type:complete len:230 (+),score=36.75 TRINITY_DN63094_c0_g1_i1:87-776(+)